MTAESQLISVKMLRAFVKRGFQPPASRTRLRGLAQHRLNGDFAKRLFDVMFSLSVLILFCPVYLVLAILIAISSPGPIFYVQKRVGRDYKLFGCLKFRTMVENADEVLIDIM